MSAQRKGAARKADDLFRVLIRARGACERCGKHGDPREFETAHIIRRRYSHTRTDERNAWCLCPPCHRLVDTFPDDFMELVAQTPGREVFEALKVKSLRREKFDWDVEVERLKGLLAGGEG